MVEELVVVCPSGTSRQSSFPRAAAASIACLIREKGAQGAGSAPGQTDPPWGARGSRIPMVALAPRETNGGCKIGSGTYGSDAGSPWWPDPTAASLRCTCPGSVKQHVRSLGKALAADINVLLLSSASTGSTPHSAPLPQATEDDIYERG